MADQNPQQQEEGGGKGWLGIVIFVLIFGVGNYILYKTTGIILIPIRK